MDAENPFPSDLMPLPAEKGLKRIGGQSPYSASFDLMPLPAEKGLKPLSQPRCTCALCWFDAPSSRKRIETQCDTHSFNQNYRIWCPFQQKKDWNSCGLLARLTIQDLMPLPAEKGLKLVLPETETPAPVRFDAPSSRKRIETFQLRQVIECAFWFDAPSSRKRIETRRRRYYCRVLGGFDAPSSRKRIETSKVLRELFHRLKDLMPLPAEKGLKLVCFFIVRWEKVKRIGLSQNQVKAILGVCSSLTK